MAQVGRISGPLLQENLLRNGIDLSFETDLIYLDVSNQRIGIKTTSPTNELQNPLTTRTTNLIVDTEANFPILNFTNSDIQPFGGTNNIILDARYNITANRVKTDDLLFDDDRISTYTANTNIELRPNAAGITEFFNLYVDNNFNITGDVRLDGDITFGNADTDSVTFDADITSNIIPDTTEVYRLGSPSKRWQTVYTKLINGTLTSTVLATVGNVDIGVRPGNLFYVSTNGDNDNTGTHIHDPYRTIDYAVTQATAGDTILVMPGEYEETCPIEIPAGVAVRGVDIRNVVIKPPASDNYVDIFLLNGESTVTDLTVKDFYYDSINDVGYAFRFADNATITTRSPYIQNVTVITAGSVTSADDPRGFAQGDAGKGALVDGADVLSTSRDASMLFHSVTFITPGVDALTMTNGVRVEWLNSFTYFANRGLYAVDGATGHLSTDGSTVLYGAEIRSIGSANVYGNYGAVADGPGTLMYLIQHNMAYIGVGKYVDNDPSRVIQSNEIVKLNSGKIYYQTVNHYGDFRIGDNFFINQETGESSIIITEGQVQGFGRLRATTNGSITLIDGEQISTGNLVFTGNLIESVQGTVDFNSAGVINLQDNTNVSGNVDITGDFTFDGTLNLLGNEATDTLKFNVNIDQNFNPNTDSDFDLGSLTKRWNNIWTTEAQIGDIKVEDNFITTDVSNSNLELRANGTGEIYVPSNNLQIDNNLTVSGTTDLQSISVTGLVATTGLLNITGDWTTTNFTITKDLATGSQAQFEEILFDGNIITTTTSNADLELRSSGAGKIITSEEVDILNNLQLRNLSENGLITVNNNVSFDTANVSSVTIQGNRLTQNTGSDLDLTATGNIRVSSTNVIVENSNTVNGITDIDDLTINGTLIHTGNLNQTGDFVISGEFSNGNIILEDNFISTSETNSNLELRANSTGNIFVPNNDVIFNQNLTVNGSTDLDDITINGTITHIGDTNQTGDFTLLGEFSNDNIVLEDNFITTTTTNSNLELRANGTGEVVIDPSDTVTINNNLFVGGVLDYQGFLTINGDVILQGNTQEGSLTVTEDFNITGTLDVTGTAQFEEILVDDNFITTTTSNADLELRANGAGVLNLLENTIVNNNLSSGTINSVDIDITNDFIADEFATTNNNVTINDNYITTETSNANLELRASGTGEIYVPSNDVILEQNLTVNGITDLDNTTIIGKITHTGNRTQTGDYSITGDITLSGEFTIADQPFQFENIRIDGNVLQTTLSNSDLDLRSNGTGTVNFQNNTVVTGNLTSRNTTVKDIIIDDELALENMVSSTDIEIFDNVITTTNSNSNLELRAAGTGLVYLENIGVDQNIISTSTSAITLQNSNTIIDATGSLQIPVGTIAQRVESIPEQIVDGGDADDILTTVYDGGNATIVYTSNDLILDAGAAILPEGNSGDIRFNTDYGLFEGFSLTDQFFGGVFSQNTLTNIQAIENILEFTVEGNLVGSVNVSEFILPGTVVNNLTLNNNSIISASNVDLLLTPDGAGDIVIGDTRFDDNKIVNTSTGALTLSGTSDGYTKIGGTYGTVVPSGDNSDRRPAPVAGEFRWNTELERGEIYDGTQWVSSAGALDAITEAEYLEILDETILIFG